MIYYLTNIIITFIRYGLSGFFGDSLTTTMLDEATLQKIEDSVLDMLDKHDVASLDYEYSGRVLTPFERHLSRNFSPDQKQTKAGVVESMLLSLNHVAEEIQRMLPGSNTESRVDGSDLSNNILKGHLGLDIDTVTSDVYPIFMDLLKVF